MTRVLVIDNYDSFTWNLVHLLGPLGDDVDVVRNDAITTDEVLADAPDAIVLSPGPCTPTRPASASIWSKRASPRDPDLRRLPRPAGDRPGLRRHGRRARRCRCTARCRRSSISGEAVFRGINGPFQATRYHSLIVDRDTCPADLAVTAETGDGLIMGLSHRTLPIHGVQFHPESILSEHGVTIMRNSSISRRRGTPSTARPAAQPHRAGREPDGILQTLPRQGRNRRVADARRGARRLRRPALRRGHARPGRRLPDGAARARRGSRRDRRRGLGHARAHAAGSKRSEERHRHRRHRRRPLGQLQHLDARRDHRRRLRRAGRQARQPRGLLASPAPPTCSRRSA